jgi:hypothetical protein
VTDRLEGLLEELGCLLGKMTLWRALCWEWAASTDEQMIGLAEWNMGTRAAGHSCWFGLQGVEPEASSMPYRPTGS